MSETTIAEAMRKGGESVHPPADAMNLITTQIHRKRQRRRTTATLATTGLLGVLGAGFVVSANPGGTFQPTPATSQTTSVDPTSTSPTAPTEGPTQSAPVSVDELDALGISASSPGDRNPTVTRAQAESIATGQSGDDSATSAVLYLITTTNSGTQLQQDPSKASDIDPMLKSRLTWVVTLPTRTGDAALGGNLAGPTTANATTVQPIYFIDADTGEVLFSIAN